MKKIIITTALLLVALLFYLSWGIFQSPKVEPIEKIDYSPTYEIPLNSKG